MTKRPRRARALLDVNILVALAMPNHEGHFVAHEWLRANSEVGWATTPITECGFIRVVSNRRAIATATTPAIALDLLEMMTARPGHEFWVDDLERVLHEQAPRARVTGHRQVTDAHLLSLALAHEGRLVTFDRSIGALAPEHPDAVEVLTVDPARSTRTNRD